MTGRRVTDAAVVKRTLSVMVTCGMYDAAGDWVSAVGMPAKSGVGGGIVAVLPGQLGIGVVLAAAGRQGQQRARSSRCAAACPNSSGCTSLRCPATRARRCGPSTSRVDNIRVYETHGDLLFCGAEQVVRTVDRERDSFDVAILDVSRVDDIDDAARALLSGMSAALRAHGQGRLPRRPRRHRHPHRARVRSGAVRQRRGRGRGGAGACMRADFPR